MVLSRYGDKRNEEFFGLKAGKIITYEFKDGGICTVKLVVGILIGLGLAPNNS